MVKVFVTPEEVWSFFNEERSRLAEGNIVIAKLDFDDADKAGVLFLCEERGQCLLSLETYNEIADSEYCHGQDEARNVAERFLQVLKNWEEGDSK